MPGIEPQEELLKLIKNNLPPGARITSAKFNRGRLRHECRIAWRNTQTLLSITREEWDDQRLELIALLSRLSVASPETTRKGRTFFISYDDTRVEVGRDVTIWAFSLHWNANQEPTQMPVTITGTAHALLDQEADKLRHDQRAFRIAIALLAIKVHVDNHGGVNNQTPVTIDSDNYKSILTPVPARDQEIREYVAAKLHQAHKGGEGNVKLEFSWIDFIYLGIGTQDFERAVKLNAGRDWNLDGFHLTPSTSLVERLDQKELTVLPSKQDRSTGEKTRIVPAKPLGDTVSGKLLKPFRKAGKLILF